MAPGVEKRPETKGKLRGRLGRFPACFLIRLWGKGKKNPQGVSPFPKRGNGRGLRRMFSLECEKEPSQRGRFFSKLVLDGAGHFIWNANSRCRRWMWHGVPLTIAFNALYVGFPSSVGSSVRMGNLDSERDVLTADIAFCHVSAPPYTTLNKVNSNILSDSQGNASFLRKAK